MKAAHIVSHRQIEVYEAEDPKVDSLRDGSVVIKTHMTAICGTDSPRFTMQYPDEDYPQKIGLSIHECIGTVTASKSGRFKEGDEVMALPREIGGLAEYFVSHDDVTMPLTNFKPKDQILMAQPLGTLVWACRKLGNIINQDAVVVGQGPMGLLMVHLLSNLGARTIVAVDTVDFRLAASKKMHATHTINPNKEDLVQAVSDITEGRLADLVVEIVGHNQDTVNTCLDLVKRQGTLLCFGIPDDAVYSFEYGKFFRKNIHMIGSVGPEAQRDFPLGMAMISQGRMDVSPILTHHFPFTEVQQGFELFCDHRDEAIKVVLDYD